MLKPVTSIAVLCLLAGCATPARVSQGPTTAPTPASAPSPASAQTPAPALATTAPAMAAAAGTPEPASRPARRPELTVYVSVSGALTIEGGITLPPQDLPLFVSEVARGRRVVVRPGGNLVSLSRLVEARDQLRSAGVEDVTFLNESDASRGFR